MTSIIAVGLAEKELQSLSEMWAKAGEAGEAGSKDTAEATDEMSHQWNVAFGWESVGISSKYGFIMLYSFYSSYFQVCTSVIKHMYFQVGELLSRLEKGIGFEKHWKLDAHLAECYRLL